jgi:hypothetical protein
LDWYVTVGVVVHCANNITGAVMVKESPAAYGVPVPLAFVFQPANTLPVLVRAPVLPTTETVEPDV